MYVPEKTQDKLFLGRMKYLFIFAATAPLWEIYFHNWSIAFFMSLDLTIVATFLFIGIFKKDWFKHP